jgi:hypothetical protein
MDLRELQDLYNNLKNTNPDALKDPMVQLLAVPQEQEKQEQVEASPDEPKAPSDPFALNIPSANTVPSSFDVSSGNQAAPMTMDGQVGNTTPPPAPASVNPEIPALEGNPLPPIAQDSDSASPVAPGATKTPAATPSTGKEKNPLDVLVNRSNADFDARQQFNVDEAKRRKLSMIPLGLAGVGDAISNAASAFGAKGKTGETEYVQSELDHLEKQRKDMFDKKLTTDPNSQISQNYRETLAMMMQVKPSDPKIANLSADQISQTLPEVEKFMQHKLQMEMTKAQKELARNQQEGNERDRLWTQSLQTVNTLRGDKPLADIETQRNAAITAYNRLDELKKAGKGVNPIDYIDILGQLYKARTGSAPTQEVLHTARQETTKGKFNQWYTYFTGQQAPATTSSIADSLQEMASSMGHQTDKLHEKYMQSRGGNAIPARLKEKYPEDAARLESMQRGGSFAEMTGQNTDEGSKPQAKTTLAPNEEVRQAKDGRKIVYDKTTKQPLRIYGQ